MTSKKKIKVLNLYAGIGGNRKLWPDDEIEVTAVEFNPEIAAIYQDFFPNDKVIVGDAHEYLRMHYKEFDFIWASPPCPSHSDIRRMGVDIGRYEALYPDMKLYEEIIFLKHFFKGKWVIENVIPYYEPLIRPQKSGRHYFWSNFNITDKEMPAAKIKSGLYLHLQEMYGINISKYKVKERRKLLRNCVHPKLGLHVWKCAFKEQQQTLTNPHKL